MKPIQIDRDIELRLLAQTHVGDLFSLVDRNRTYLREWLPWVDGTQSSADTANFIASAVKQHEETNGFHMGIWFKHSLVGVVGLHELNAQHRKTSLGYWLSEDMQGRGIISKAVHAVVEHLIRDLKMNRVEIKCAIENRKSRAIPERLGFKLEGTLRDVEWLGDHFNDHAVYAVLTGDWNARMGTNLAM